MKKIILIAALFVCVPQIIGADFGGYGEQFDNTSIVKKFSARDTEKFALCFNNKDKCIEFAYDRVEHISGLREVILNGLSFFTLLFEGDFSHQDGKILSEYIYALHSRENEEICDLGQGLLPEELKKLNGIIFQIDPSIPHLISFPCTSETIVMNKANLKTGMFSLVLNDHGTCCGGCFQISQEVANKIPGFKDLQNHVVEIDSDWDTQKKFCMFANYLTLWGENNFEKLQHLINSMPATRGAWLREQLTPLLYTDDLPGFNKKTVTTPSASSYYFVNMEKIKTFISSNKKLAGVGIMVILAICYKLAHMHG